MAIDYTPTPLSVAARTTHFVDQICTHANKGPEDFETFEKFVKFLDAEGIRSSAGYNKNKAGYMETLRFIWQISKAMKPESYVLEVRTATNSIDEVERTVYTNKEEALKAFEEQVESKVAEVVIDNGLGTNELDEYVDELQQDILDSVKDTTDPDGEWQIALFEAKNKEDK